MKIVSLILCCGMCFLAGCQDDPNVVWYKPGNSVTLSYLQWQNCKLERFINSRDCMYRNGYQLLKKEELPQGIEIEDGVAGINDAVAHQNEEERYISERKQFVEDHPNLSDEIKQAILAGNIIKGMARGEISIALNRKCINCQWRLSSRNSYGYEIWDLGKTFTEPYSFRTGFDPWYTFTFAGDRSIDWIQYGSPIPIPGQQ